MRRTLLVGAWALLALGACDDESAPAGSPQAGREGQPCASWGCDPGLVCTAGLCAPRDAEVLEVGLVDAAVDAAPPDAALDADAAGADAALDAEPRRPDLGPVEDGAPFTVGPGGASLSAAYVAGRPAVAFYDADADVLRYAWARRDAPRHAGEWVVHAVDARGGAGRDPSLVELDGRPAIAYHDFDRGDLLFARATVDFPRGPEDWRVHVVDAAGNVGLFADLAVTDALADDRGGALGVAYYDADAGALKWALATRRAPEDAADWQVSVVDDAGDAGQYASVVFEAVGVDGRPAVRPVIAYREAGEGALKRAVGPVAGSPAGAWAIEVIDDAGDAGQFAALSEDGRVMAYRDGATKALKVARQVPGEEGGPPAWRAEVVDDSGDAGHGAQITVRFGRPLVTWLDARRGQVKQAQLQADDAWSARVIETQGQPGAALAFAPAPCGVEDDRGVGRHTGLVVYGDDAGGAVRFAYDAEPEGNWFLHHLPVRAGAGALTARDGLPVVFFGDRARGGVGWARADTRLAVDTADWRVGAVAAGGRVSQVVATRLGEGWAVAWRDDPGEAIAFAWSAAADPEGSDAWTVHRLPQRGDLHLAGLVVVGDAPALAVYDRGARVLRYARATTPTPAGPEDWLLHVVEDRDGAGAHAVLSLIGERPHLVFVSPAEADDAPPIVALARATLPAPASSADWVTHDVGVELTVDKPVAGLALGVFEGAPAIAVGADGVTYAYARSPLPADADDWQRHVADARRVVESPVLGALDGTPALLYGLGDPDAGLWLGTTRGATPRDRSAWRFARLATRAGPTPTFRPLGARDIAGVVGVAYAVDGCVAYGWAAAP